MGNRLRARKQHPFPHFEMFSRPTPPRHHPTQPISACAPEQKNKSKMTHPIILLVPPSICANPHSHTSRANVRPSAHTPAVAPCKSTPKKRPPFFCPPLPHMPWRPQGPKKSIFGKIPRHHWSMTPRIHQGSSRVPACRTNRPALLHRKWSLEVAFAVEDGPDEARCKISVTGWMGAARVSRRGGGVQKKGHEIRRTKGDPIFLYIDCQPGARVAHLPPYAHIRPPGSQPG